MVLLPSILSVNNPPVADALLQVGQEELAVEGVDGRHVGEDVFDHLGGERAPASFFCEARAEHLRPELEINISATEA